MIAVIDSGVANTASVMAALERIGADAAVTADAAKVRDASHVIFPGVGAAAAAMAQLASKKLIEAVRGLTQPVLGICLGMQVLFERSEENGGTDTLGAMPGTVRLLRASPTIPVPHMGWNRLALRSPGHPLLRGIEDGSFVYFVHSYAAPVAGLTLASARYGEEFSAMVGHGNFYGCQFHPERSGAVGQRVLENFLAM